MEQSVDSGCGDSRDCLRQPHAQRMAWSVEFPGGTRLVARDGNHRWIWLAEGSCEDGSISVTGNGGPGGRGLCRFAALLSPVVSMGRGLRGPGSMRFDVPVFPGSRHDANRTTGNTSGGYIPPAY